MSTRRLRCWNVACLSSSASFSTLTSSANPSTDPKTKRRARKKKKAVRFAMDPVRNGRTQPASPARPTHPPLPKCLGIPRPTLFGHAILAIRGCFHSTPSHAVAALKTFTRKKKKKKSGKKQRTTEREFNHNESTKAANRWLCACHIAHNQRHSLTGTHFLGFACVRHPTTRAKVPGGRCHDIARLTREGRRESLERKHKTCERKGAFKKKENKRKQTTLPMTNMPRIGRPIDSSTIDSVISHPFFLSPATQPTTTPPHPLTCRTRLAPVADALADHADEESGADEEEAPGRPEAPMRRIQRIELKRRRRAWQENPKYTQTATTTTTRGLGQIFVIERHYYIHHRTRARHKKIMLLPPPATPTARLKNTPHPK